MVKTGQKRSKWAKIGQNRLVYAKYASQITESSGLSSREQDAENLTRQQHEYYG